MQVTPIQNATLKAFLQKHFFKINGEMIDLTCLGHYDDELNVQNALEKTTLDNSQIINMVQLIRQTNIIDHYINLHNTNDHYYRDRNGMRITRPEG